MAGKGFAVFRLLGEWPARLLPSSLNIQAGTKPALSGRLKVFRLPEQPLKRRGQPEKGGGV